MKKYFAIICVAAMIFSMAACGSKGLDKAQLQLSEYDGVEVNEAVQMFIKQKTVTDASELVTLAYENLTDKDYTYDAGARLEVFLDGNWYLVPALSDAMTMELYHLAAGAVEQGQFVLSGNYDKLEEGSYRVIKLFVDSEGNQAVAAAQFDIGRA